MFVAGCADKDERPNILFIMSDDHAYQAISAYDDRLIQTKMKPQCVHLPFIEGNPKVAVYTVIWVAQEIFANRGRLGGHESRSRFGERTR